MLSNVPGGHSPIESQVKMPHGNGLLMNWIVRVYLWNGHLRTDPATLAEGYTPHYARLSQYSHERGGRNRGQEVGSGTPDTFNAAVIMVERQEDEEYAKASAWGSREHAHIRISFSFKISWPTEQHPALVASCSHRVKHGLQKPLATPSHPLFDAVPTHVVAQMAYPIQIVIRSLQVPGPFLITDITGQRCRRKLRLGIC